ncbi:hypothetical protein MtrunA17_Chr3g0090351 [Medicago truncatula]|uniref:Uncharacterized protein n=1 Tax=Medicago truncatula TaxID=3880 RepID=A0A396IKZ0_MEDTR|nr:hypothetical protein MtrunA17_Chr3g0090351 [Medicago truncatula]
MKVRGGQEDDLKKLNIDKDAGKDAFSCYSCHVLYKKMFYLMLYLSL